MIETIDNSQTVSFTTAEAANEFMRNRSWTNGNGLTFSVEPATQIVREDAYTVRVYGPLTETWTVA